MRYILWRRVPSAICLSAIITAAFWYFQKPGDILLTPFILQGKTNEKLVALTFDDGPHPITTALLLDILKRYKVPATFFVVGKKAAEYPEFLKRIANDGHEIACHSYTHQDLAYFSADQIDREIQFWQQDIDRLSGKTSRYLRPPGGDYGRETLSSLRKNGYTLALWSLNTGDWKMPPAEEVRDRVLQRIHPGAVILLHDNGLNTIQALPGIIRGLQQSGYRFVTLDQMANR